MDEQRTEEDYTTPTENRPQDYFNFLMETFRKIVENSNPQVIYAFLEQNLDKFDDKLINTLDIWSKDSCSSIETEKEAIMLANTVGKFSKLIQEFTLGYVGINQEIAIKGYEIVIEVSTFDACSKYIAIAKNNLANIYIDRIKGEKAENIEQAITYFKEVLKFYNFASFPKQWALIKNNLGNAYCNRIRENKAENLENAIYAYNEALKVRKIEVFPQDWATTKTNLASAYLNRIKGVKADNLEKAITLCQEALKVKTFEKFPQDWAIAVNNLATIYLYRIRGEKGNNLEQAIAFYKEALKVFTFKIFPSKWALIQNNLGEAYRNRIRGERGNNLEQAIAFYKEALRVFTFKTFPSKWALVQGNLALIYCNRIKGNKAENLEQAILCSVEALKVYRIDTFPQDWAITQINLATIYLGRIEGDKADNIEQIILYSLEALNICSIENFPQEWAAIQNNLGEAYRHRIKEGKVKNLVEAINYYRNALKIYTKENNPFNCLKTARNLANLHYTQKQWQPATEAYHTAIEAIENARLEALNPQSRQEVLSNAIDVFHRIVQAYLNLNQPEKALEYIERSKGRNLVEFMTQKGLKPQNVENFSPETIEKLAELKQQVVNEQIRLQHQSINQNLIHSDNLTPYVQDQSYLKKYQQELDSFIEKEITPHDENFQLTQKVQTIPFEDIKALTDDTTCLLQLYMTGEKILAFIVSADGRVNYWESSKINRKSLDYVINNYTTLYNKYRNREHDQWKDKLNNFLETIARIIHINHIIALIPNTCQRLIIIPHWFLHILPLHALPIDNNRILQDKYDIQYAPSCQLLQITKQRPLHQLTNLFAVQNPTKDLIFTDLEVNIISTLFNKKEIIAKDKATKSTVTTQIKTSESDCYHFSCHGNFNPDNPLESTLLLAKPDKLTLGEIFELNLKKSRLVVLSACETGLIDLKSISDEYIGLPAGFLFAGSSSVVSSLWKVNELSTAFLMMKFYEIILDKNENIPIPVALKMAQDWLKNLTVEKYQIELKNCEELIDKEQERIQDEEFKLLMNMIKDEKYRIKKKCRNQKLISTDRLFNNPFYWSAFIVSGV